MQNSEQALDQAMQRKGRMIFLLMLIFFVVPIVIVILMYKLDWKPAGSSLGVLVRPARLLSMDVPLKDNAGSELTESFWRDKWSIVYVAAECEQKCLNKLHDMRRLHASLYKDMARAQRVLITTSQDVSAIKKDYPDLIVVNTPNQGIVSFSQQFKINNEEASLSSRLYFVDPLGHLVMSYPEGFPLANIRKDLTRLLRYSWAG